MSGTKSKIKKTEYIEKLMEEYHSKPYGMTDKEFCFIHKVRKYQIEIFKQVLAEEARQRILTNTARTVAIDLRNGKKGLSAGAKLSIRGAIRLVQGTSAPSWECGFEDLRHLVIYNMCMAPNDERMKPIMARFLDEMEAIYGKD